ncbi:unnamed protein product [Arctogadus glacialis]
MRWIILGVWDPIGTPHTFNMHLTTEESISLSSSRFVVIWGHDLRTGVAEKPSCQINGARSHACFVKIGFREQWRSTLNVKAQLLSWQSDDVAEGCGRCGSGCVNHRCSQRC